ncbi:MAG: glycosyltransferase family 2 protein [Synechococcales bacterium]|nr:glycosyltransferase family 2 protein [Synechococcales bacterium]
MQEKPWLSDSSHPPIKSTTEPASDHHPQTKLIPESPNGSSAAFCETHPFQRGQSGRRRKAAFTLTLVWSSTVALHLVPGGSWLVLGVTAMMGLHVLRILLSQPDVPPDPFTSDDVEDYPYISILVAAKNEEAVIRSLVQNLCTLDYPIERYDVWLIDDYSTDNTPAILERLARRYDHLRVVRRAENAGGGKSGALNQVWPLTQGEIIAVFDADAQVPSNLLRQVVPLFAAERAGAVQVRKAIANASTNFWTRNQAIEMVLDACIQQQRVANGGIGELRGNGQFVRRVALEDCNGWNEETITDDLDLTLRLHLNQWDIDFLPYPAVKEEGVTRAVGLWHQRNRWAEGGFQRYLDYWRLLVQNRLGLRKSIDLCVFYTTQYLIPTAAVPDLLMAVARGRLPILTPLTALTLVTPLVGMVVGLRRVRAYQQAALAPLSNKPRSPLAALSDQVVANLSILFQSICGLIYMCHWLVVIASTVIRISIRPKRLKWVKTVHYGTLDGALDGADGMVDSTLADGDDPLLDLSES